MNMAVADKAKNVLKTNGNNANGENGNDKPVPRTMSGLKANNIRDILDSYKLQIAQVLPNHVTPERILQVCTTVISANLDIKNCTAQSIIGAVLQSSILNLDPTPHLGQCYFVPYYNKNIKSKEVQFQIGYKGLIQLIRRTGDVASIYAHVVYESDKFAFQYGLYPDVQHKPTLENRGDLKYAYAIIKYKDQAYDFEVMNREDILHVKAKSQAKDSTYSPWNTDEPEMWRKTVLKRLLKRQPLQVDDYRKVAADEAVITPDSFDKQTKEVDLNKIEFDWDNKEADQVEDADYEEVVEEQKKQNGKTQQPSEPAGSQNTQEEKPSQPDKKVTFSDKVRELVRGLPANVISDTIGTLGYSSIDELLSTQMNDQVKQNTILVFTKVREEWSKQGSLL